MFVNLMVVKNSYKQFSARLNRIARFPGNNVYTNFLYEHDWCDILDPAVIWHFFDMIGEFEHPATVASTETFRRKFMKILDTSVGVLRDETKEYTEFERKLVALSVQAVIKTLGRIVVNYQEFAILRWIEGDDNVLEFGREFWAIVDESCAEPDRVSNGIPNVTSARWNKVAGLTKIGPQNPDVLNRALRLRKTCLTERCLLRYIGNSPDHR